MFIEIDTGGAELNVKPSAMRLKTYTGESIPTATVDVTYGRKNYSNLELVVVHGEGTYLLRRRDWLSKIHLDWRRISMVVTDENTPQKRLDALLQQYQEVFADVFHFFA